MLDFNQHSDTSSDDDYEDYEAFMLKYACGNPDEELGLEDHGCQPLFNHRGERVNGEKCFCREDYCFDPETDEKYLEQFREARGPLFT